MLIVEPRFEVLSPLRADGTIAGREMLELVERAGRTCYKSEERIVTGVGGTAHKFVQMILARGHESVLEHASLTVLFVVDRGVSHEIVRHRLCAFSQESTRYCNYGKGDGQVTFVHLPFWAEGDPEYMAWKHAMLRSERMYLDLLEMGAKPEQARSVLPNSLKTEVVVTANLREWRHILRLRTSKAAHPQMRQVMVPLLQLLRAAVAPVFDGIVGEGEIPSEVLAACSAGPHCDELLDKPLYPGLLFKEENGC